MRTKLILTTAALGVASSLGAFAQVYSVNAVGYVNTTLKPGFNLICNPLNNTTSNSVEDLFPAIDNLTVFKYQVGAQGGGYVIANYSDALGGWDNTFTLAPGEGCFVNLPGTADVTVTFVGEVMQTTGGVPLSNTLPQGLSMKSSMVPQAGKLQADLGFPVADNDTVYLWNNTKTPPGYDIFNYSDALGGWDNGDPNVAVGVAFFLSKAVAGTWVRDFTVN
jgi:hypothetical protein